MAGREKAFTRRDGTLDPYMPPNRSGIDIGMYEFAAVTESAIGTKRTCLALQRMSAFGGKADMMRTRLLMTQSVGLPPPFQSEQFCSVTVIDTAYIQNLASVRAAGKTATYRILHFPQLAA